MVVGEVLRSSSVHRIVALVGGMTSAPTSDVEPRVAWSHACGSSETLGCIRGSVISRGSTCK